MDICFAGLIPVLQDLVCQFAYSCTAKDLRDDVDTAVMIRSWNLPPSFFTPRVKVRDDSTYPFSSWQYTENPVYVFKPSKQFAGWRYVFDWDNIYFLLHQFDFRLKIVRAWGTRETWWRNLRCDWTRVEFLSIFFKTCQRSNTKIIKPTGGPLPIWFDI